MIKKLFALILLTILFTSLVTLGFYTGPVEAGGTDGGTNSVALPMNAVLTVEVTIGDKHVEYFEHIIDDVIWVKNDYVLIHVDPDTNETIRYNKSWRDIELPNVEIKSFQPSGGQYFWKKVAVFLNKEDCGNFYTFYDINEYPLVCWEVRYIDGTTVLYDLAGCEIGEGVPAPSEGFSLTGYDDEYGEVPKWRSMRENADQYFQAWCDSTISVFSPTKYQISWIVSDPETLFYYALAHGGSYSFRANENEYYYDDDAYIDVVVAGIQYGLPQVIYYPMPPEMVIPDPCELPEEPPYGPLEELVPPYIITFPVVMPIDGEESSLTTCQCTVTIKNSDIEADWTCPPEDLLPTTYDPPWRGPVELGDYD